MTQRMDSYKVAPGGYKHLLALHRYLESSGLETNIIHLVYLRASQINGCAYCIDMHWKDLRALGESEQRLYMLNAWQESPGYSERERAALAWTEAVTLVSQDHVPDEVYRVAREQFSEAELANLTLAVALINAWNRMNVAFRREAGGYQPATAALAANGARREP